MFRQSTRTALIILLAGLSASSLVGTAVFGRSNQAQAAGGNGQPTQQTSVPPTANPPAATKMPAYLASRSVVNDRAINQYRLLWGIDNIEVKSIASGSLIKFTFRVLDPKKAKSLNEETLKPQLVDEASHYALQIPVMDQVGQLRQTATPEAGRVYWMVFSNKGGYVRPGSRVDILIGKFRADGLVVQ